MASFPNESADMAELDYHTSGDALLGVFVSSLYAQALPTTPMTTLAFPEEEVYIASNLFQFCVGKDILYRSFPP